MAFVTKGYIPIGKMPVLVSSELDEYHDMVKLLLTAGGTSFT